jgi:hypothetical protein
MGVKVRVHGFRSPEAAEVAGKTALAEFLEGLSIEESWVPEQERRPRKSPRAGASWRKFKKCMLALGKSLSRTI